MTKKPNIFQRLWRRVKLFLKMLKNLFLYTFFRKRMSEENLEWTTKFLDSFKHFSVWHNIKRFFDGLFYPEDFNYEYAY